MSRRKRNYQDVQSTQEFGALSNLEKAILKVVVENSETEVFSNLMPKIEQRLYETFGVIPQKHEVKTPNKTVILEDVLHEKFDEVLQIVNLDIPVYLTGKAGVGKNIICQQVAKALGLDFYFTNAVTQEYKLTGFIDANGHYQETQFYKAFTQGGLFFLDEMDASIPEVLIILNAAIANRYFDFPIGKIEAHPNFRIIAAGNTVGLGANNVYTGRYCLDRASLDRFAMIAIDYSEKIEKSMARGKMDLVDFAHAFRKVVDNVGMDCLFSYRTIERIALLENVLSDLHEVMTIALLKGLILEDVETIYNKLKDDDTMKNNKYVRALINNDE